jgi:hypothetical protein
MGEYAEFFKFAAKAGALEGYLYEREKIESLSNWVNNMKIMYDKLPADVKKDIKEAYGIVLTRTLENSLPSSRSVMRAGWLNRCCSFAA